MSVNNSIVKTVSVNVTMFFEQEHSCIKNKELPPRFIHRSAAPLKKKQLLY